MATTQDLIADVNTEVAKLNQMTAGKGYSQLPKLSPITPGNITDNPVPIETKPSEVLSGTQKALIDNQTRTQVEQPDQFTQAANNQAQQLKTAEVTAFEDYITSVLEAPTFSEVQNQVYGEAGVDALKAEVNRLNSEMLNEQDALRTKIEKIQREGGGLKSGAQAEIANLERESLAKQSDIALLQIAATGQWEVAQEAADRAVNAMFEREEKMADVRKEVYNRTKEQWTKAEQRAFEIAEGNRQNKIEEQKFQRRLLQNTKLDLMQMLSLNEAPDSLKQSVAKAESPEEAVYLAGKYGSADLLDRAIKSMQYSKAQLEYQKLENELAGNGELLSADDRAAIAKMPESRRANSKITLLQSLNNLKGMVQLYGAKPVSREKAAEISSARAALQFAVSQAFEQGAIQAGDREQYEQLLGAGMFDTSGKTIARIDTFTNDLHTSTKADLDYIEATYPGAQAAFAPFANYLDERKIDDYLNEQLVSEGVISDPAENPYEQWLRSIEMYE